MVSDIWSPQRGIVSDVKHGSPKSCETYIFQSRFNLRCTRRHLGAWGALVFNAHVIRVFSAAMTEEGYLPCPQEEDLAAPVGEQLHQRVPFQSWCVTWQDLLELRQEVQKAIREERLKPTRQDVEKPKWWMEKDGQAELVGCLG